MKQPTPYETAYRAHMLRDTMTASLLRAKHKVITARLAAMKAGKQAA